MTKFREFLLKHRDFLIYTVFGFLASVINIVSFMLIKSGLHVHYIFANTLAWLISVVFGFFTNKSIVFKSEYSTGYALFTELIAFFFFRGMSLLADSAIMVLGISVLHMSSFWAKTIDQLLVGLLNYATTRFTFSKEQKAMTARLRKLRQERLRRHRTPTSLPEPSKTSADQPDEKQEPR